MSPNTARIECYAAIKDCVRTSTLAYLKENRSVISDEMAQEAVDESLAAMECIFKILDGYEITRREQ